MPEEKPKDGEKRVAFDVTHPKYCPAGKRYCNNIVIRDASIGSKMCVVSSLPGTGAQIVDAWTRCPCLEKAFFTSDPYEQAFVTYNRSLTNGISEPIAFKIFKQAVERYFVPKDANVKQDE